MNMETIVIAVIVVCGVVLLGTYVYVYLRDKSMENIREDVYGLILKAEHIFMETGAGRAKMNYVVANAKKMLPKWLQAIVTEELLESVIQMWFDAVKDLLDDGKLNKSQKKED